MKNQTISQVEQRSPETVSHVRGVVESLLFVNERPISLEQIRKVIDTVTADEIKQAIDEIQKEFGNRKNGMTILEIAGGYQMLSNPLYANYVRSFYKTKHKEKLSNPALEALAIVAYKQPVTRADIEIIRGVNSDGVVVHLLEKELIKCVGRKDIPGRPYLYGTTKQFLEYFGLKSLSDLPKLEEFPGLQPSSSDGKEADIFQEQSSVERPSSPTEQGNMLGEEASDIQGGAPQYEENSEYAIEPTQENGISDEPTAVVDEQDKQAVLKKAEEFIEESEKEQF